MPTVNQLQKAKKTLKKTKVTKRANKPRLPNSSTYAVILADPKTQREKQLVFLIKELVNRQKKR